VDIFPFLSAVILLTPPVCKSKSKEPDALVEPGVVAFTFNAVNATAASFHVWLIVTGAEVVIVPVEITKFLKVGLSPVPNPKLVRAVPAVGVSSLRLFAANRSPLPLPPETGNQSNTPPALIPRNSPATPSLGMSCLFTGGSVKE
jgi:hypothetical protein